MVFIQNDRKIEKFILQLGEIILIFLSDFLICDCLRLCGGTDEKLRPRFFIVRFDLGLHRVVSVLLRSLLYVQPQAPAITA